MSKSNRSGAASKKIKFDKKSVRKLDEAELGNVAGGQLPDGDPPCPSKIRCCPTENHNQRLRRR
jgi:hypothetical protein